MDTKDIHWVINPSVKPTELYEKGQIEAFLGFPPEPQDSRAAFAPSATKGTREMVSPAEEALRENRSFSVK
jgi:hypothetical protein